MKKIMIFNICLIFITILIISIGNSNDKKIIESYDNIVINDNLNLTVYEKYNLSDLITINNGNVTNDYVINTTKLGEQNLEVLYIHEDILYKAKIDINVIDNIKPIILGGSSYTIKKGDNKDLSFVFLSVDNYDSNPKREVIGNHDINTIGTYNLILKVTDNSNNSNEKRFNLNVVEKIKTTSNTTSLKDNYSDVYNIHKSNETMIGLDISKWQGDVDYNLLKENKVEFVFLRVGSQGGFNGQINLDVKFLDNIRMANEVGIPVGVYFYTYALTKDEAISQAKWIVETIKDYKIDLPIVYDFESWSKFQTLGLSLYDINFLAKTFMDTVSEYGYKGMNYSSKYYLEHIWDLNDYPVWLAHYTSKTNYNQKYDVWQLSQTGRIPGINGNVDINVLYNKDLFNKEDK